MNYCVSDVISTNNGKNSNSNNGYYCDFNNTYYQTYQQCYQSCGLKFGNHLIHISDVDFTFIVGIWAVLLAVSLFFAFHLSHD
jgi:hypothetical protein